MSIHAAPSARYASDSAYIVVPPRASDVLSHALRDAYPLPEADIDPFGDLLGKLDRIDIVSPAH